ncbi:MAG: BrnT family toxin [Rhodoplanes sp.]
MEFEWDPAKHERNLRERGIGFDEAALIFDGEVIVWPDMRAEYGEVRLNAIGEANGKILRVTYTVRGEAVRIITAWRANRKDRQRWQTRNRPG